MGSGLPVRGHVLGSAAEDDGEEEDDMPMAVLAGEARRGANAAAGEDEARYRVSARAAARRFMVAVGVADGSV